MEKQKQNNVNLLGCSSDPALHLTPETKCPLHSRDLLLQQAVAYLTEFQINNKKSLAVLQ